MNRAEKETNIVPELEVLSGSSAIHLPEQSVDSELEIDLVDLLFMLLSKLRYIVLFFLLGAVLLNAYSYFLIHPSYQSTSTLYIVSASGGSVVDLTDLNIGTSLKSDYEELIMSYPVLDRVTQKLNLDMTTEQIAGMISITNPTDTRILKLTVTAEDPELAKDIVNTLAKISVKYLPDTMNTDAPNIAQRARLATHKSGPSYSRYTMMGGLLGAVLCCAYLIVRYLMDDTIRGPEDMEKYFGEPPLASIPYVEAFDEKKHKSGHSSNRSGKGKRRK